MQGGNEDEPQSPPAEEQADEERIEAREAGRDLSSPAREALGPTTKVWERWSDWNELVCSLQQELLLSQEMLDRTEPHYNVSTTNQSRLGSAGKAKDTAEVIRKLRGYLEELHTQPVDMPSTAVSVNSTVCAENSSKLRLIKPTPPLSASIEGQDLEAQVQELIAAAEQSKWLSSVVREHAHSIIAASSLCSFRAREVLIDTRNRRRGTVFLVVEGEVSLIFRSHAPDHTGSCENRIAGAPTCAAAAAAAAADNRESHARESFSPMRAKAASPRSGGGLFSNGGGRGGDSNGGGGGGGEARGGGGGGGGQGTHTCAHSEDPQEGWAVAGVGALFGSTAGGLEALDVGSSGTGAHLAPSAEAIFAKSLNFHYTLKAWGKRGGRVRCFERRAVASCLLPLLHARRQAAMLTLASSEVLALLPDDALRRLADAARDVTWVLRPLPLPLAAPLGGGMAGGGGGSWAAT